MPLDLPPPSPAKLNPHFILGEIIDHIRDLAEEHPSVDINLLRKLLIDVRNHQVDPEKTLRSYVKAFLATNSFKAAIAHLDADTTSKIQAFADGKSAAEVTSTTKDFKPRSASSSQHRFRLLDVLHRLLHDHKKEKGSSNGHISAAATLITAAPGLPIVYEDTAETQIMEVSRRDYTFLCRRVISNN
jgi:hypothetical protein